ADRDARCIEDAYTNVGIRNRSRTTRVRADEIALNLPPGPAALHANAYLVAGDHVACPGRRSADREPRRSRDVDANVVPDRRRTAGVGADIIALHHGARRSTARRLDHNPERVAGQDVTGSRQRAADRDILGIEEKDANAVREGTRAGWVGADEVA